MIAVPLTTHRAIQMRFGAPFKGTLDPICLPLTPNHSWNIIRPIRERRRSAFWGAEPPSSALSGAKSRVFFTVSKAIPARSPAFDRAESGSQIAKFCTRLFREIGATADVSFLQNRVGP